jgi:hypothetical protein
MSTPPNLFQSPHAENGQKRKLGDVQAHCPKSDEIYDDYDEVDDARAILCATVRFCSFALVWFGLGCLIFYLKQIAHAAQRGPGAAVPNQVWTFPVISTILQSTGSVFKSSIICVALQVNQFKFFFFF